MNDQEKQRQNINLDKATAWGLRFSKERCARKLSTQDVADALLLSTQQIVSLENSNLQSFYNAKFFVQAADKYAVYLGLEDQPSGCLFAKDGEYSPADLAP